MSADNGIYIAPFTDGFRVAYGQAIDDVSFDGVDSEIAKAFQYEIFKNSIVFVTLDEAEQAAFDLESQFIEHEGFSSLEYGTQLLMPFPHPFPKMTDEEAKRILRRE